ncbi:UNVERIFIED_CONTAM: hypothetical protein PYX00_010379 [Menopon gallinae]|uniref:tRNA-specific adenosine deaminase 1 n=1 Tax=Menopon gallinae TaxID=328185 RepID=A0AAW2HF41_9NEOP
MDIHDLVMRASIDQYEKLPKTGKPKENEWTIMSSIVGAFQDTDKINLVVLSLGTGSKCIGRSFMSPGGDVLNDSHSEVIARRGFLRYLYTELIRLNECNSSDIFYRIDASSYRVGVKDSVKFYFTSTASPCGDASIIPKADNQSDIKEFTDESLGRIITQHTDSEEPPCKRIRNEETQDIHRTGAKCLPSSEIQDPLLPGVNYHQTGAVRTKPGRGDPTLSVSCSDKLARWNAVGIQGALLSIFIEKPIRMEMIVIGGGCPYSNSSCDRAINQRTGNVRTVTVRQSDSIFPDLKSDKKVLPSASSIIWYKGGAAEVSVNGRRQGTTKKNLHKKTARTCICKKNLLTLFAEVVNGLSEKQELLEILTGDPRANSIKHLTYRELKSKATNYICEWENVKNKYLKVWTQKPECLLNFKISDE